MNKFFNEIREGFNRDIEETDCFLKTGTLGKFNPKHPKQGNTHEKLKVA